MKTRSKYENCILRKCHVLKPLVYHYKATSSIPFVTVEIATTASTYSTIIMTVFVIATSSYSTAMIKTSFNYLNPNYTQQ